MCAVSSWSFSALIVAILLAGHGVVQAMRPEGNTFEPQLDLEVKLEFHVARDGDTRSQGKDFSPPNGWKLEEKFNCAGINMLLEHGKLYYPPRDDMDKKEVPNPGDWCAASSTSPDGVVRHFSKVKYQVVSTPDGSKFIKGSAGQHTFQPAGYDYDAKYICAGQDGDVRAARETCQRDDPHGEPLAGWKVEDKFNCAGIDILLEHGKLYYPPRGGMGKKEIPNPGDWCAVSSPSSPDGVVHHFSKVKYQVVTTPDGSKFIKGSAGQHTFQPAGDDYDAKYVCAGQDGDARAAREECQGS